MVAETRPTPQKYTNGSKYTNEWMTCIASRVGRITCHTESMRPDKTPSGIPMMTQTMTATRMKPIVRAVCTQNSLPRRPHTTSPAADPRATVKLRTSQAITNIIATTTNHGMAMRKRSTRFSSKNSNGHAIASSTPPIFSVIQLTASSIQLPNGILNSSRTASSRMPGPSSSRRKLTETPRVQSCQ